MPTPTTSVARYYDRNTRGFLRYGRSGSALAIHRGVWAPGVTNADQAARWVNHRIADLCGPGAHVLDLGCGVGGTLIDLAQLRPDLRGTGITISAAQASLGAELLTSLGLDSRLHLVQGDFTVPWEGDPADVVVAVESLIHVAEVGTVLDNLTRHLGAGSRLVVCDDFLEREGPSALEDFRRCWHAHGLRPVANLVQECARRGLVLVEDQDLTPWLRLRRPQDWLVRCLAPWARWGSGSRPGAQNLVGGNALNALLRSGHLSYRLLSFVQH